MNIEQLISGPDREKLLDQLARNILDRMFDEGWFKTCLNCQHWNREDSKTKPPDTCGKFGDQRPPARIIVTGCPEHSDNIPF